MQGYWQFLSNTFNVAVLARGLPGLTLIGCGPRQLIHHWHQASDVANNIIEENLEQAGELVKEMIAYIDMEFGDQTDVNRRDGSHSKSKMAKYTRLQIQSF